MKLPAVRRLVFAIAIALFARPAGAFHTVFDFSVDRFEFDGNRRKRVLVKIIGE